MKLFKYKGFSLIEMLISILIFSIVFLGSGLILKKYLAFQNQNFINSTIVNELQIRIQSAMVSQDSINDICKSFDLKKITIQKKIYYFGCSYEEITIDDVIVKWPILAATEEGESQAENCAKQKNVNELCYIIGR